MEDSFSLDLFAFGNDLHSPYVPGATFSISLSSGADSTVGWTLVSSDATVLSVSQAEAIGGSLRFNAQAGVAGQAKLTARDASGNVVDTAVVSVVQPTSAVVYSYARMLEGDTDAQSQVNQLTVASGGTATLLVRYFAGTTEVSGIGTPALSTDGSVAATLTTSSLSSDRDWLELSGLQAGTGDVKLTIGGNVVATVPATIVDGDQVASIALVKQSDAHVQNGTQLSVLGRAFDTQGGEIFGASYGWSVDGTSIASAGQTDVALYTYQSGTSDTLQATFGTLATSTTIHALHTGDQPPVQVTSTEAMACSVTKPGASAAGGHGAGFALLGIAGVLAARKKRAARNARSPAASVLRPDGSHRRA